jgi:hypothetical protein
MGKGDPGVATEACYFIENSWLTLCDERGNALRSEDTGARYTVRLEPGDNELRMAKRLALRHHEADSREEVAGFNRRIVYGRSGLA